MELSEINGAYAEIHSLVAAGRLCDGMRALREMLAAGAGWEVRQDFDAVETAYGQMLRYFEAGVADPDRDAVYGGIVESLLTITDRAHCSLMMKSSPWQWYAAKRMCDSSQTGLADAAEAYRSEAGKAAIYKELPQEEQSAADRLRVAAAAQSACYRLFDRVMTLFPASQADVSRLTAMLCDDTFPEHARVMMVSAVYLNLTRYFQEALLSALFELYASAAAERVRVTALCCAIIIAMKYPERAGGSLRVSNLVDILAEDETFCRDARTIALTLVRYKDTERLARRMEEEILPGIIKLGPSIMDKLGGGEGNPDDGGYNPMWHEALEKSGLARKLQELEEIGQKGGDVLMGTFARLKNFSFFSQIYGWFTPFHPDHPALIEAMSDPKSASAMGAVLGGASFICDSDKFSLLFSFKSMTEQHRQSLESMLASQSEAIKELKGETEAGASSHDAIVRNYLQCLCRFVKLYSYRSEHYDPTATARQVISGCRIEAVSRHGDTLGVMGEYCMGNGRYDEAIECFEALKGVSETYDPAVEQKIGYCHEKLGRHGLAVKAYTKFDLWKPDDLWNLRHLGACCRSMGDIDQALLFYRRAEGVSPENVSISLSIGHCLLAAGEYKEALKAYFKAYYLDKNRNKALRPIAWCAFLTGNLDMSGEYYAKISENLTLTPHDYMNMGHLELCSGNRAEALARYRQAVSSLECDDQKERWSKFVEIFEADVPHLIANGLSAIDVRLLLDGLRAKL